MLVRNDQKRLSMILPLLLTLLPVASISSLRSLVFPLTILVLIIYSHKWIFDYKTGKRALVIIGILFMYAAVITSSMFSRYSSISDIFQVMKPLYFATILLFGMFVAEKRHFEDVIKGLLKSSYIIISFQVITSILQLLNLPILNFIYSADKSRPFGTITRVVGTMGNPNTFGWFVIQAAVVIFIYEKRKTTKTIWLAITLLLLIFSGSRSMIIVYPVAILLSSVIMQKKGIKFYFIKLPFYVALGYIGYISLIWFLESYGDLLPYMKQILPILKGGSLDSINSFGIREIMWTEGNRMFMQEGNLKTWLFGLGANTIETVDNGYLYALFNTGILGLLITLLLFLTPLIFFIRLDDKKMRALGVQYILLSLIIGYQADTFSGWIYPSLLMYYCGIAIVWKKMDTNIYSLNLFLKK